MKELLGNLLVGAVWLSLIAMFLATITSIGYFLYLWGSVSLAVNVAAWTAFLLWIKIEAIAALFLFASIGIMLVL